MKVSKAQKFLCEEVEWQLTFGQGWYSTMKAVGYETPESLARQLHRYGRHDLAARFETSVTL